MQNGFQDGIGGRLRRYGGMPLQSHFDSELVVPVDAFAPFDICHSSPRSTRVALKNKEAGRAAVTQHVQRLLGNECDSAHGSRRVPVGNM